MSYIDCTHCSTDNKFHNQAYVKHCFTAHLDIIKAELTKRYKGRPRPRSGALIITINKNDYYVCLCCCQMWRGEAVYNKHQQKLAKCDYGSQIIKLNELIGENFAVPDIRRDQDKMDLFAFTNNHDIRIRQLEATVKVLLAANKVLTDEIQQLKRQPATFPTIKRPEPTNDIVQAAHECHVVQSDMTELPNDQQMPILTVNQRQEKIVCIDCGYPTATEQCGGCQGPICMPRCASGPLRPMCEGPCNLPYCEKNKCAEKHLNDDDYCRVCAKNE